MILYLLGYMYKIYAHILWFPFIQLLDTFWQMKQEFCRAKIDSWEISTFDDVQTHFRQEHSLWTRSDMVNKEEPRRFHSFVQKERCCSFRKGTAECGVIYPLRTQSLNITLFTVFEKKAWKGSLISKSLSVKQNALREMCVIFLDSMTFFGSLIVCRMWKWLQISLQMRYLCALSKQTIFFRGSSTLQRTISIMKCCRIVRRSGWLLPGTQIFSKWSLRFPQELLSEALSLLPVQPSLFWLDALHGTHRWNSMIILCIHCRCLTSWVSEIRIFRSNEYHRTPSTFVWWRRNYLRWTTTVTESPAKPLVIRFLIHIVLYMMFCKFELKQKCYINVAHPSCSRLEYSL